MSWILISIVAYFCNAISALTDKFLLNTYISHPSVYAFYVSLFSIFALIFTPFGFSFPGFLVLGISLVAGILFTSALLLFFSALQKGEASRVVPLIGGISPIFVFILAWLILSEILSAIQIVSFLLILFGGFLIAQQGIKKTRLTKKVIFLSLGAAFLFALSHVLTKWVYVNHLFISGLVWRSIGSFVGSGLLLLVPTFKNAIFSSFKQPRTKMGIIFIGGQLFAAASFVLINYAFSQGSITLVNALAGTQYLFLFFLIWPLSYKFPNLFQETITRKVMRAKLFSLAFISLGIFLLFV